MSLCFLAACASFSGPTRVERNVAFKEFSNGTPPLKGDFYFPKTPGLHPALIVVHGGGWITRSGRMEAICKKLARNGYVAFNATYRLAPQTHFPDSVDDIRDAIRFVRAHAVEFGIDPSRIGGWGYSAGSNMLLLAALDGKMGLNAIVSGGTPSDLTEWKHFPIIEDFIGAKYKDKPELWRAASPVNHVTEKSPPVFLYHGGLDEFVEIEQMYKLETAMQEKHRPVKTYVSEWLGHFTTYLLSWEADDRALDFLSKINRNVQLVDEPADLGRERVPYPGRVRSSYLQ